MERRTGPPDRRRQARGDRRRPVPTAVETDAKLFVDLQRLQAYITGLQAEVEAKVRMARGFQARMQNIETRPPHSQNDARALLAQVNRMLETNRIVRETLQDLRSAAEDVLKDLTDEGAGRR